MCALCGLEAVKPIESTRRLVEVNHALAVFQGTELQTANEPREILPEHPKK